MNPASRDPNTKNAKNRGMCLKTSKKSWMGEGKRERRVLGTHQRLRSTACEGDPRIGRPGEKAVVWEWRGFLDGNGEKEEGRRRRRERNWVRIGVKRVSLSLFAGEIKAYTAGGQEFFLYARQEEISSWLRNFFMLLGFGVDLGF